jgi:hypothetical protein
LRISVFVVTFALLVVALAVSKGTPFVDNAFSGSNTEVARRMSFLPPYDLAALKVRHVITQPRFDIGVFGNSRAVSIGRQDLNIGDRTFFNFSVPGTSMRQSINLIEELALHGKAPKLAIISFDNMEFGYYGNALYPGAFSRWWRSATDVTWTLVNRPGDIILLAHVILDHIYAEWDAFIGIWNATAFWSRAAVAAPDMVPELKAAKRTYLKDGSRPMVFNDEEPIKLFRRPRPRMILLSPYMARDFERLAVLDGPATKIVIFESHLEAASTAFVMANPEEMVITERKEFLTACEKFNIACSSAEERPLPETNSRWGDCCHAPPDALGELVSTLVRKHAAP